MLLNLLLNRYIIESITKQIYYLIHYQINLLWNSLLVQEKQLYFWINYWSKKNKSVNELITESKRN